MKDLPREARAVVIGGGILGCSTAYHLARLGWADTVVLEAHRLTSGSTWHAAGLVGQLRSNASITRLLGYSVELYGRLEAETGQATGWKANGGLRLACTRDRLTELRRQATTARSFGLEMHLLSPREARELWPPMAIDDLVGAAFLPTDGQANPADIAQALARGSRQAGVRIHEDTPVTGFVLDESGRVRGVETARGTVRCEAVANCAGQWARAVGAMAGVNVPLVSVQHQYLVTEPIPGVERSLPTLRDPDRLTYFKEEVGGLVMGGYEPNPKPWAEDGVPEGFHDGLLDSDWDHFEPLMGQALARVPALATAGVKQLVNGPESFTPDGYFILGEAPEVPGFWVGAGFNAFGIAAGGGAGMALAEWIVAGEPPFDLWPVDIRRFGSPHRDVHRVRARTLELYAKHYAIAWPGEERASARPARRSPLYDRLAALGACFGEKLGWERPNWFADLAAGEVAEDRYAFERPGWFEAVGREHRAAREAVAVFDQSSFTKLLLVGRDAEGALSWLCANDVAVAPGRVVYTQMLNRRGGIEADLTVTRLASDRYYLVAGTASATRDPDWIRRNLPAGTDAHLVDLTSARGVLSVMGPRSRRVLAMLTAADLSDSPFPFAAARELVLAGAPVLALRVSYVGELGYELHVPAEYLAAVFDALLSAGAGHGLRPAGYRAIETLRLEKGYRAWGAELGPDYTPLEAGLGFAVKLGTDIPFLGREALERQRAVPLARRLAGFSADPAVTLLGRETIYRDGERVGWLASGGHGYTVERAVGFGYVRHETGVDRRWLLAGRYELEVAGERVPVTIHPRALHDPGSARMRG
jgi:sarcosine dehydrogenase